MTVKTLIELVKTTDNFNLQEKLAIKRYIPVMDKKKIAMDVIAACTDDFNGFIEVDRFKMGIYFDLCVLQEYTNLEVPFDFDEMIEAYDLLGEFNMLSIIFEYFEDDYEKCKDILDNELQGFLAQNSLEAQVIKVVNKINSAIDEVAAKLSNVDLQGMLPQEMTFDNLTEIVKLFK